MDRIIDILNYVQIRRGMDEFGADLLQWKYGRIAELRVVVLKWCLCEKRFCDDMRKFLLRLADQVYSRLLRRPAGCY
jgi:hypothetical protein